MKLYYAPGACSLAVHIVLREASLPVELVKVDLASKTTDDGRNYLTLNPKGYVPTLLLDDGQALTEVSVLLQYIADQSPEAGLLPAPGTLERYRALEWIGFIATEIHKGFGPLWSPATPELTRQAALDTLARRFYFVERQLDAAEYLTGSRFAAPDAYAFTVLNWTGYLKVDLERWPNIRAFLGRVAARPRVREALKAEGLA
ncbi:glutathione transferase GstA [Azospirillum canadense]|uniref:glutathione transferase GstA n=1 Tax=Azospirillum canadense TaxID=403962 RepID=UPI00222776A2|nr:glutathione transferase GstA [Azospirillum canadense]MCW2239714.1 glutathione S-transferase [Azospirillum canadense]